MSREIVVDINPYQTRVVLLEDHTPCEVFIEQREHERLVGNIYLGRVQNVLPGMQAAFVDISLERNAFLYAGDIQADRCDFVFSDSKSSEVKLPPANIKDIVKPGQEIMVQVVKEGTGNKGARVTTHVTLPVRTLVLMPTVNYVGVSRRIENEAERSRLKSILDEMKPATMGVIVRTAAEGKAEEVFKEDLRFLTDLWSRIQEKSRLVKAPGLIHAEESLVFRTIRDLFTPDIDKLYINDPAYYEKILAMTGMLSPALRDRVILYDKIPDMFQKLGIDTGIDQALSRKVWFKNGGYIIIDRTEALTTIDVNTGKYVGSDNLRETITETNCEAAREIAKQLRLRDISGIIIIDFIDMDETADQERVLEALKDALKKDRVKSSVMGITALGLVEMTRKKTGHCIDQILRVPCPYCGGDGKVLSPETVLLKARKKLLKCFSGNNIKNYVLKLHPQVATFMEASKSGSKAIDVLPRKEGIHVHIDPDPSMHVAEFEVVPITDESTVSRLQKT